MRLAQTAINTRIKLTEMTLKSSHYYFHSLHFGATFKTYVVYILMPNFIPRGSLALPDFPGLFKLNNKGPKCNTF